MQKVYPHLRVGTKHAPDARALDKATMVLSLLVEGSSIRSAERITGVHRDTICRLIGVVGPKCQAILDRLVQGVKVADVQADGI
ncbi:MAG: helix-turn-helix domain-containing protein [Thermoanaerobaculia bacterium]|nr:helix-turn-helix domain-containing protein [Thermoanaerobaculia bacterium]